jgi:Uma2 family endonuclease
MSAYNVVSKLCRLRVVAMATATATTETIVYPDSDGQPMAENTLQFEWIVTVKLGLDDLFVDDPNVFVAGDLLWYPVEGEPKIRQAPDAMVVFGRPKGYRGSYMQWKEGGLAPHVVFEILLPGNRYPEMVRKFDFYERHGVEEYYVYDPDEVQLLGWTREGGQLRPIRAINGWRGPRLGVRFEIDADWRIIRPDGRHFATYAELVTAQRDSVEVAEKNERLRAQLRAAGLEPEV